MEKPKTKSKRTPPRTREKTVRTIDKLKRGTNKAINAADKTKNAYNKVRENIPSESEHQNPEGYMVDKVTGSTEYSARKAGRKIADEAKKLARKSASKAFQKRKVNKEANSTVRTRRANNSIRNAGKSGKRATVKSTGKAVKSTKKGVKTTTRTAKKTVKTSKRMAMRVKKAAVNSFKTIISASKAIIAGVKGAITAIKGLVTIIAAGGWIAAVVILIIAVILLVISSPFGIFVDGTDGITPTISEIVQEINIDYSGKINAIIVNAGDIDEIIIEGESDVQYSPTNWVDVLGVFSVKATMNSNRDEYMDVLIMDENKVNELKNIFWDMNIISYEIIEEILPTPSPTVTSSKSTPNSDISPTPEPTPEIKRTLIITTESKTYEQGSELYKFNDEQNKLLEELMSPDYFAMFMEICGMNSFNGLTIEQTAQLINDLPEGYLGSTIVEYAISRLGDPYSQVKRGQGSYVDCSYLARWCYQQAGVSHFTAGTAAEQARYCVNNSVSVSKQNLQAGDLIFWSFNTNGRFMNITHVGIYVGNGYVIDASSSRGMVVYREIFGESSIVVCGRPHIR